MRWLPILTLLAAGCGGDRLIVHPPPEAERLKQSAAWIDAIGEVAEPGDWLVIRGYHPTDDLVVAATNIPLSHVAVLDRDAAEVIEAVGEGVRVRSLGWFVDHSHRLLVVRPQWWTPDAGREAVRRARALVGRSYDFLGTVGGGVSDRFYCSELAVQVYGKRPGRDDHLPQVVEPGQMYLFGRVLWDSGWRD